MNTETIIFWVPGTSNHAIHPYFESSVKKYFGNNQEVNIVDYASSWQLVSSVATGVAELKQAIDEAKKKKKRILIGGESQGTIVISEVLKDPKYYDAVSGAALLGHPWISSFHNHKPNNKILEINHPLDIVTFEFKNAEGRKIMESLDELSRMDLSGLPYLLWTGLTHPIEVARIGVSLLHKYTGLSDPHVYNTDMDYAALWLHERIDAE